MEITISLSSQELDMSLEARMKRAEILGFDTKRVWYHGSLKKFDHFDAAKSGTAGFCFSIERGFAQDYASTKSIDTGSDASAIIRDFLLPKKLFDFRIKEHLQHIERYLPDTLYIEGRYGWAAFFGGSDYSKEQLLDAMQGIDFEYTGISDEDAEAIRKGAQFFTRDGSKSVVVKYHKDSDIVDYVDYMWYDSVRRAESILQYNIDSNNKIMIPSTTLAVEYAKEDLNKHIFSKHLTPRKLDTFDNWSIFESPELKPYIIKAGYEGAIMRERRKINAIVYRANRIRSVNAAFNLYKRTSTNIMD